MRLLLIAIVALLPMVARGEESTSEQEEYQEYLQYLEYLDKQEQSEKKVCVEFEHSFICTGNPQTLRSLYEMQYYEGHKDAVDLRDSLQSNFDFLQGEQMQLQYQIRELKEELEEHNSFR